MLQTYKTIGEMSADFSVTARALRFYEAKELLFPKREGKKRLYSKSDCARLKLILMGKRFGFSLEQIRQLLELYHVGDQQQSQLTQAYKIARERLTDMENQRDELDAAIDDLKQKMKWGEKMLAAFNTSCHPASNS